MSRETEQQVRLFATKTDDLASVPGTYWPPASTYMMWPVHALSPIQNNKKKKLKPTPSPRMPQYGMVAQALVSTLRILQISTVGFEANKDDSVKPCLERGKCFSIMIQAT